MVHHWVFKDTISPTTLHLIVHLKMERLYGVSILGDTQNPSDGDEHPVPDDPGWSRGAAEAHSHLSISALVRNNMFLLCTELSLSVCGALSAAVTESRR